MQHGSWSSLYSPGMDRTENVSSIIACSVVAGEICPQSCSLATAVVLSPVYIADTWHWVYMSQYNKIVIMLHGNIVNTVR
jgi:hypothetical protein